MTSTDETSTSVTVHIKGPSALKLSLSVSLDMTVLQLKERIEQENKDFPADRYVYAVFEWTTLTSQVSD